MPAADKSVNIRFASVDCYPGANSRALSRGSNYAGIADSLCFAVGLNCDQRHGSIFPGSSYICTAQGSFCFFIDQRRRSSAFHRCALFRYADPDTDSCQFGSVRRLHFDRGRRPRYQFRIIDLRPGKLLFPVSSAADIADFIIRYRAADCCRFSTANAASQRKLLIFIFCGDSKFLHLLQVSFSLHVRFIDDRFRIVSAAIDRNRTVGSRLIFRNAYPGADSIKFTAVFSFDGHIDTCSIGQRTQSTAFKIGSGSIGDFIICKGQSQRCFANAYLPGCINVQSTIDSIDCRRGRLNVRIFYSGCSIIVQGLPGQRSCAAKAFSCRTDTCCRADQQRVSFSQYVNVTCSIASQAAGHNRTAIDRSRKIIIDIAD